MRSLVESVGEYKFLGGVLVTTFSVVDFGSLAVAQDKRDAATYRFVFGMVPFE